jgi:hypothetical protein
MMKELLDKNANPNIESTEYKQTPLFIGIKKLLCIHFFKIFFLLINLACEKGFKHAISILLKCKLVLNSSNKYGWTALFTGILLKLK